MCCRKDTCLTAGILGAIFGVVIGLLFFFAVITTLTTAIWIAFGFAAVSLILLTLIAAFGRPNINKCICRFGRCILLGGIATIILSLIALTVTLATGSVALAILVGLGAFAFAFTVISFIFWVWCLINANCKCDNIL